MTISIEVCRTFLGTLAEGKTDSQVEAIRDELEVVANQMFDHLQSKVRGEREMIAEAADDLPGYSAPSEDEMKRDALERVRWIAHAHKNGVSPDDFSMERTGVKDAK
jgi:hypothetical protein